MKNRNVLKSKPSLQCLALGLMTWTGAAFADDMITCESRNNQHQTCRINQSGYVTLDRQISRDSCQQGRNWDYNRREIWVDDGCRATFRVHTSGHDGGGHDSNHDAKVVAGVLVGAAILGAMAHHADNDDDKYRDDNYHGSRHSSYVPDWMEGTFNGYNPTYGASIRMTINEDGQMTAVTNGRTLRGWVNNGELHIGNDVFTINRSGNGFVTSQVGDSYNQVRYSRIN
nr:DUF3011 domain-containing protein [uncultured Pseudoxanthomonas sp.]